MKVAFARPGQAPRHNVHMVTLVVPMIVFTIGSILSCSEAKASDVPEHAYTTYGDSWRCERGFKKTRDKCQSIKVPEHAFLTDSTWGDGWKCERGFKKTQDECQPAEVSEKEAPSDMPEHAFVDFKNHWKCERGFKRAESECLAIKVPEHAFLTEYGYSWKCERGFKREGDRCSAE
jgi:hypothetical protein